MTNEYRRERLPGIGMSMIRMSVLHTAILMTVIAAGCGTQTEPAAPPQPDAGPPAKASAASPSTDAARPIDLVAADLDTYHAVLEKHQGRVILVDFWATWCVPCRQKLPKIVHLGRAQAAAGLTIVTVCMDDSDDRDRAREVLKSAEARCDNLLSKWGASTESTDQFQVNSALPYYKLYDRQGDLRYEFSGVADPDQNVGPLDDLETRVHELLTHR